MCTLTYIPRARGYSLTHSRDERVDRPSSNDFKLLERKGQTLYFPQDLKAMGSWMAFSDQGTTTCILNGGSESYSRKRSYRKSRGIVVLESFDFVSANDFYRDYDFSDIEPFTLVRVERNKLSIVIHDENETRLKSIDPSLPHIWSSTTLYKPAIRRAKEAIFREWLQKEKEPAPGTIVHFHLHTGEENLHNQFTIDLAGFLKTISLTQVTMEKEEAKLVYLNLIEQTEDRVSVDLA